MLLGFTSPALASHIIGGEMTYEYLGTSVNPNTKQYKITLKLFRDQFTTGAAMPDDVFIGIFDGIKQIPGPNMAAFDVMKTREDNVAVNPFPPCVVNADPISYHVGIYELTVELPDNANGYTATYQTCCRVAPLENVANSNAGGAGSTYSCYIPASADNGPQFSTNVSLICRQRSFTLDFSAKDVDADSLVYSFCNAYDGGGTMGAGNVNPAPPPYASVIYYNGFTATAPLGKKVVIDPKTGIISGVAPDVGKYVVCVCVQSYRNGTLVSEHRKDFIVKVGDCDFAGAQLGLKPVTCNGFNVSFTNDNNSPLNQTYFWDFGVPSLTNDTSNLPNPNFVYPDTGVYVYKLVINRNQPCGDSAVQSISVYPGFFPGFKWTGQCVNTPIQFFDTTKSIYGAVNYWSWNFGNPFTLADTSHLQNPSYSFPNSGKPTVSFIVGNNKGCRDTVNIQVPIIDNPVVTSLFKDTTYCGKDTIQLHASANVAGNFSWMPTTKILNANTADPFIFPSTFTRYVVKLDAGGCSGIDTINANPKLDFVASINSSASNICEEDFVTLSALNNYSPVQYLWSPSSTLSSATTQSTKAFPSTTTTYSLKATWGKNCIASANATITVKKLAIANAGPDTSLCIGGAGVQLSASGGDSYAWFPTAGLNNPNIPNPIATPAGTTTYVVSVGINGCTARRQDSVIVVLRNLPVITLTHDTLICYIDTLQLSASSPNANKYLWTPNYDINNQNISSPLISPDIPTTYYVQVTDGYKCVNRDSVFINVKQFVTLNIINDTTICQTDAIKLNTTGDGLNYVWTPSFALDNIASKSPIATPLNTITYHVTASIGKCEADNEVKITVVPYPKAFAGADTEICFNSRVTLHATGGTSYLWSPASSLSDPAVANPTANPLETIEYIVTVTDTKGCPKPATDTVEIKVYPKIIANAGPRDTSIVISQPLQLHGSGGQVYLWSPATGLNNNQIQDPTAVLDNDQQYILKASVPAGCFGTDTINVKVYKTGPGLYVPNAFTPNGDGLNDVFRPVPIGIKYITYFQIYNRFGQLLFSTTNPAHGWDGTINGKPQNPDVYVWIAEGVNYLNKKVSTKGTVMLIR